MVEARKISTNGCKARIDANEGDAECLVELFIMSCSNLAKLSNLTLYCQQVMRLKQAIKKTARIDQ